MPSIPADAANDIGCEIALLWTIVFAMTDLSTFVDKYIDFMRRSLQLTILASLILVVPESAVQCRKLS